MKIPKLLKAVYREMQMRRSLTETMLMDLPPHLPRRVCSAVRRSDRKMPGSAGLRVALRWSRFATVPPRPGCAWGMETAPVWVRLVVD